MIANQNEEWDWKKEFREYFDKTLIPRKKTMKNLDRELIVDFIEKVSANNMNSLLANKREEIEKKKNYYENERIVFRDSKEVSIELRSKVEVFLEVLSILS